MTESSTSINAGPNCEIELKTRRRFKRLSLSEETRYSPIWAKRRPPKYLKTHSIFMFFLHALIFLAIYVPTIFFFFGLWIDHFYNPYH